LLDEATMFFSLCLDLLLPAQIDCGFFFPGAVTANDPADDRANGRGNGQQYDMYNAHLGHAVLPLSWTKTPSPLISATGSES
jgi:hypothetical protein